MPRHLIAPLIQYKRELEEAASFVIPTTARPHLTNYQIIIDSVIPLCEAKIEKYIRRSVRCHQRQGF